MIRVMRIVKENDTFVSNREVVVDPIKGMELTRDNIECIKEMTVEDLPSDEYDKLSRAYNLINGVQKWLLQTEKLERRMRSVYQLR